MTPTSIPPPAVSAADSAVHRYNARLGLWLFFLYLTLYAGFVGVCAYDYTIMAKPVLAGLNLAIVWGMGLIISAFVLALVYMALARNEGAR